MLEIKRRVSGCQSQAWSLAPQWPLHNGLGRTPRPWWTLAVPLGHRVTTGKPLILLGHHFLKGTTGKSYFGWCKAESRRGRAGVQCRGPSRQVTHINPPARLCLWKCSFPPRPFPLTSLLGSQGGTSVPAGRWNWSLFAISSIPVQRGMTRGLTTM